MNHRLIQFTILTLTSSLVLSENALGCKVGEPPGKFFKSCGISMETGFRNLGFAIGEVVTMGELGRRRERERIAHQKELAKLVHENQVEAKQQAIRNQEIQIGFQKNIVGITQRSNVILGSLHLSLKSNLETMRLLSQNMELKSLELDAFKNIVKNQLNDLSVWLNHMGEVVQSTNDPTTTKTSGFLQKIHQRLAEKVNSYVLQLENIPQSSTPEFDQETIDKGLQMGFEALALIEMETKSVMDSLDHEKATLADLEAGLVELKK